MPGGWNKISQDKIDLICKLYSEGLKLLAIAYEAGVCVTTVKVYTRKVGLRRVSYKRIPREKIDLIVQRHREGVKVASIAVEMGVSEATVKREKYRMMGANR